MIWSKQKGEKVLRKKVALTGFEPGPPDPKSTIYTPTLQSTSENFEKISGSDSQRSFGNFKPDFQAVQRCPEVQINKIQQRTA